MAQKIGHTGVHTCGRAAFVAARYYLAGLFVVISVAAGVAIMYNVPSHRSHITLLCSGKYC